MAMTNASTATLIVPQLLKRGNYKSWNIFMEDYLISQELWDGIIVPFSADQQLLSESEWRKRNAAALNAIKISCGLESFVRIKYTRSAKDALGMLAEMHKTEPEIDESTLKASNPPLWVATTIVPELLERGNYERWSIFMKNYLVSQELWVVTQRRLRPHGVSKGEWRKKNAAALHAIQISCGAENFNHIKKICQAEEAWYKLERIAIEEEISKVNNSEHKEEEKEEEKSLKITTELLERGNYKWWSMFMENYLVSQDLWVVIQHSVKPNGISKREWKKKNVAALHAIEISCGEENLNQIKKIRSAIEAWNKLKRINIEEEKSETDNSEHEEEEEEEEEEDEEEEEEEEETPKINSTSMIVPELLASDNYKRWSICMKSYLVSHDLWDAVVYSWAPAGVDTKEWIKKDATALHAIQISCRPKKFDEIEKITSAKTAWNTLKQKHKEKHPEDIPFPDFLHSMAVLGLPPLILYHHFFFFLQCVLDSTTIVFSVIDLVPLRCN
ncbi:hypothetical protein SLEP1_g4984 [Rubroshorea leprosula]|uniref:DUF4219 domain-containing protein n=1 Tax=Rubroshorea leprosula TaxID=152421 RepID=A0AAV5I175_9ROSI|nr:hypothetical protein SLEP1_g4984 [Rubroshorea leprosula]